MGFEGIMLGEVNQAQKNKNMISIKQKETKEQNQTKTNSWAGGYQREETK